MANVIVHIVGGDHEDETSICSARQEIIDEIDQATRREINSTEKRSGPVNYLLTVHQNDRDEAPQRTG